MKEYFIIGLLLITYSQGQSVCSTNESCEECNELIEDFRNGRITKTDLLDRQCYNAGNPRQFACCKYRPEKKECEYNGEKCMECPTLINDFRNGKVTRFYVESKKCGNSRSTFCCPESKPTTLSTTTPTPPSPTTTNPDSPSYIPRAEDDTCGQHRDTSNIFGGEAAKPGRYPFMALIGAKASNKITWRCGGTIINRWYILTAAHCYLDYNLSQEIVNVGEYDIGEEEDCVTGTNNCLPPNQIISVQKIQNHQSFKYIRGKGLNDDISLVKLRTPIILNSYVQLICLPLGLPAEYRRLGINDYERDIIGVKAHAIGWGYTTLNFTLTDNNGTRFAKNIQQFVDLPIISNTEVVDQILKWGECLGLWTSVTHDHAVKTFRQMLFNLRCEDKFSREGLSLSDGKRLCAGGGDDGKDTCKGDSGGPLVINKFVKGGPTYGTLRPDGEDAVWIQVGLTSFGSKDCGGGKPGVYTRLSRYIDWIRENLK